MATTHYSELKVFALSTEGVENACWDIDARKHFVRLIGFYSAFREKVMLLPFQGTSYCQTTLLY